MFKLGQLNDGIYYPHPEKQDDGQIQMPRIEINGSFSVNGKENGQKRKDDTQDFQECYVVIGIIHEREGYGNDHRHFACHRGNGNAYFLRRKTDQHKADNKEDAYDNGIWKPGIGIQGKNIAAVAADGKPQDGGHNIIDDDDIEISDAVSVCDFEDDKQGGGGQYA